MKLLSVPEYFLLVEQTPTTILWMLAVTIAYSFEVQINVKQAKIHEACCFRGTSDRRVVRVRSLLENQKIQFIAVL